MHRRLTSPCSSSINETIRMSVLQNIEEVILLRQMRGWDVHPVSASNCNISSTHGPLSSWPEQLVMLGRSCQNLCPLPTPKSIFLTPCSFAGCNPDSDEYYRQSPPAGRRTCSWLIALTSSLSWIWSDRFPQLDVKTVFIRREWRGPFCPCAEMEVVMASEPTWERLGGWWVVIEIKFPRLGRRMWEDLLLDGLEERSRRGMETNCGRGCWLDEFWLKILSYLNSYMNWILEIHWNISNGFWSIAAHQFWRVPMELIDQDEQTVITPRSFALIGSSSERELILLNSKNSSKSVYWRIDLKTQKPERIVEFRFDNWSSDVGFNHLVLWDFCSQNFFTSMIFKREIK